METSNKGRKIKSAIFSNLPFVVMLLVFLGGIVLFAKLTGEKRAEKIRQTAEIAENAVAERTNIEVITTAPTEIVDSIMLPGVVRSWESVTLKAEVTGRITEILKDEGDVVKQGDVIARIDNRDYIAAVKEAKSSLEKAKSDLERNETLFKKKVISQSVYDSIVAPALAAEAGLDMAELALERTEIKASFDGVVNQRYIQVGALVTPGTAVVDVLDTSKVRVNIFIPEKDVLKVTGLEEAKVYLTEEKKQGFDGKKVFLSLRPADGAQAYKFQLEVDNKDGLLRPGMFVESDIVRGIKQDALVLPLFAVIPVGTKMFCYVEEDGIARRREIETGIIDGDRVEVVSGLKAGERVIIKGQRQLEEGELVEVVKVYNSSL